MARKKKKAKPYKPTQEDLTELQRFDGIGKARATKLLTTFKGMSGVLDADLPALQEVIPAPTAESLFKDFHGEDAPTEKKEYPPQGRYTEELGESIASDYAEGKGTIKEIMLKHGLSERIFYIWRKENIQFFRLIKNAHEQRNGRKLDMALTGMQKLLEGMQYTEQQTEAVPVKDPETGQTKNVIQKSIITQKYVAPNPTMIIFTLCNLSPEDWKHVAHIKHEGTNELPPYDLSKLSDEELEQFEKLASKASTQE